MDTLSSLSLLETLFLDVGRLSIGFCISICMNEYVYQIHGALEDAGGRFKGLRVLVCDLHNFESVDVPSEILDNETAKFIQFRLKVSDLPLDIQRLPVSVQNRIREPLGRWLDYWVRKNFYGITGKSTDTNT